MSGRVGVRAKRYALFLRSANGEPVLLKGPEASDKEGRTREFLAGLANNEDDRWSEHGLGHLLNPTDPDADDREWVAQVWLNIIRRHFGLSTQAVGFESLPAVGQVSISSPPLLRPFKQMNRRKHYQHQVIEDISPPRISKLVGCKTRHQGNASREH